MPPRIAGRGCQRLLPGFKSSPRTFLAFLHPYANFGAPRCSSTATSACNSETGASLEADAIILQNFPTKKPSAHSSPKRQPPALKKNYGQPTHESRPHLVARGELTKGIIAAEYRQRRHALARKLQPGDVALLRSADLKYRSGAVFNEFHQDSNFFYLTGFNEPEAVCVIEKTGDADTDTHVYHLFVQPSDERAELWSGPRSGVQAVVDVFEADEAGDIDHLFEHLEPILARARAIHTDVPISTPPARTPFTTFFATGPSQKSRNGLMKNILPVSKNATAQVNPSSLVALINRHHTPVHSLRFTMDALRLLKSSAELGLMSRAASLSASIHNDAIKYHHLFETEGKLHAFFDGSHRMRGADREAYVPVVASGTNALTVHYTSNDDVLQLGDLVRVDAGSQVGGYVSDMTRTWPISGKFSPAQRALYEVVLAAQKHCISLCCESTRLSLDDIHNAAVRSMVDGLRRLGFSDISSSILQDRLFPHHVGHYLGLDVHDSPSTGRGRKLEAGMVVTVEPGLYVPLEEKWPVSNWPDEFKGLGVQVEDVVAVGKDSPTVLSRDAVKEVEDIERLAAEGKREPARSILLAGIRAA